MKTNQLPGPANWWRDAVVYQIYPRSFADGNGDGIGDLKGILSRVDYLASLGIDAVWLSPFFPSQLADGGYDVDDYQAIDERIGTLEEFDELVSKLHENQIRVFVDIVPNHSSNRHAWFKKALEAAPGSPARDRYIFRDGKGPDGSQPPSKLASHFGPEGWTQVPRWSVVHALVYQGATRLQLGQRGSPPVLFRHPSILVRSRRGWVPNRCCPRTQEESRDAA